MSDPHRTGFARHSHDLATHPSLQRFNQIEMQLRKRMKHLPCTQELIQTNSAGRQNLSLNLSALQHRKNQNGNDLYTKDRRNIEAILTTHTHKKQKKEQGKDHVSKSINLPRTKTE